MEYLTINMSSGSNVNLDGSGSASSRTSNNLSLVDQSSSTRVSKPQWQTGPTQTIIYETQSTETPPKSTKETFIFGIPLIWFFVIVACILGVVIGIVVTRRRLS